MYSKRQYNAFSALSRPTRPREKRAASAESPFVGALPYMVPITDEVRASIIIAIIVRKYSVRQLFFTTFSQNRRVWQRSRNDLLRFDLHFVGLPRAKALVMTEYK